MSADRATLRHVALTAVIGLGLALPLAACSKEQSKTIVVTPTSAAGQGPKGTPTAAVPGDPDRAKAQAALEAISAGDAARMAALVVFTPVACAAEPQGSPPPPKCPSGTPNGAKVPLLVADLCAPTYVAPLELEAFLRDKGGRVYAVSKLPSDPGSPEAPQGVYGVVVASADGKAGSLFGLDDKGKIVTYRAGCGVPPAQLAEARGKAPGATWVVAPVP